MSIERGSGRPKRYQLVDGTVVPSVTTILKARTNADGLIAWAMREGHRAEVLRDEAAHVGSVVHDYMESLICGDDDPRLGLDRLPEHRHQEAEQAAAAARDWLSDHQHMRPVAVEVPLVSERAHFAGTADLLAYDEANGCHVVIDWKTSKRFYVDHAIQTGAYALLFEECREVRPEAGMVVRLPKDGKPYATMSFGPRVLEECRRQFMRLRRATYVDQKIERFFGLGRR